MTWTSNRERIEQALTAAVGDGLTAGAHVYRNAVIRGLRGGYTSGAFVTGTSTASVTVTPVERVGDALQVRVGTNLMYNLFWELGHLNLFTRRFERVEVWRPALFENADRIRTRVLEVAAARLQAMVPA